MAKVFKSFEELSAALLKASTEFTTEAKGIAEVNVGEMSDEATFNAPASGDPIATQHGTETQEQIKGKRTWVAINQSIGYEMAPDGLSGTVFVNIGAGEIAIWVEFGTGQSAAAYLATVEEQFRKIAAKYYINGKGTIINKPYLLPAYYKYKARFEKEMREAVKNITFK